MTCSHAVQLQLITELLQGLAQDLAGASDSESDGESSRDECDQLDRRLTAIGLDQLRRKVAQRDDVLRQIHALTETVIE